MSEPTDPIAPRLQQAIARLRQFTPWNPDTDDAKAMPTNYLQCPICTGYNHEPHDADCLIGNALEVIAAFDALRAQRTEGRPPDRPQVLAKGAHNTVDEERQHLIAIGLLVAKRDTGEFGTYAARVAQFLERPEVADLQSQIETLTASQQITADTSDGYHTFRELYEYRKAYNALLFNEWAARGLYDVHKSWRHSDGEPCFGGGWFIVIAQMPTGQISNHYKTDEWALFQVPERERGAEWDGHTPQIALERLLQCAQLMAGGRSDSRATWQPIDSVPEEIKRVGTPILGFVSHSGKQWRVVIRTLDRFDGWYTEPGKHHVYPTLWQPLPSLPSASGEDQ